MRVLIRKISGALKNDSNSSLWSFLFVEFILVIVGVLIALQLDNWNHQRNLREKEAAYLEDIRLSLDKDLKQLDEIIEFNRVKDSCISVGIELLGKDMDNEKRANEFLPLFYTLGNYMIFRPDYVAFENMVSTESIDLIKDDAVRERLSEYYTTKEKYELDIQARVQEKTRQFMDYVGPVLVSNETAATVYGQDLEFQYGTSTENEFHKNPRVFYDLVMMSYNISDQNNALEGYEAQIHELLKLIIER